MSQASNFNIPSSSDLNITKAAIGTRLIESLDAVKSGHSGAAAPAYISGAGDAGAVWVKTVSATLHEVYVYDGDDYILVGSYNPTTNTFTPVHGAVRRVTTSNYTVVAADNGATFLIDAAAAGAAVTLTLGGLATYPAHFGIRVIREDNGVNTITVVANGVEEIDTGRSSARLLARGDTAVLAKGNGRWITHSARYQKQVVNYTSVGANSFTREAIVPLGCPGIVVGVVGGGGGGGGGNTALPSRPPGGGGGGAATKTIATSALATTETATVGAGGAGGASGNPGTAGAAGGTSSFGAHVSATGGAGGLAGNGNQAGVAGGSGASGDYNWSGQSSAPTDGGTTPLSASAGGDAGGPLAGAGGRQNVGVNGQAPGGGGGGGNHTASSVGGSGAAGLVRVETM